MEIVNIFAALWRNDSVPRSVLDDLKTWLAELYKQGHESLRTCIVQGAIQRAVTHGLQGVTRSK